MLERLVVLISGRGTNFKAIHQACQRGELNAEIVAVISDSPEAAGLDYAQEHAIPTKTFNFKNYSNRAQFEGALSDTVNEYQSHWIILAGFMRVLSGHFVDKYKGKIVNIHPSLLPKYPGLNTHQRAIDAGDKVTGASVHFVTAVVDDGPLIKQTQMAILPQDNATTLKQRLLPKENILYVEALALVVNEKLRLI